jgi:hypothetical protein
MAHWRRVYRPTSHFDYIALWAIGASMLVGGARVCLDARVRVAALYGDLRSARLLRSVPPATLFGSPAPA